MTKISKGKIGAIILGAVMAIVLLGLIISIERIPVGYEGVVYSMNGGVQKETLTQGWHLIAPTKKVKKFTISNEQLLLTKDKREGSKGDDSFKVSTADDASIAISFQMSYRYDVSKLVDTYKRFKGMDGEDIVNNRVKSVLKSKVSEVTTTYTMMDIYSGNRSEINKKLTEYLNESFSANYGIEVLDASIVDVHPDEKINWSNWCKSNGITEKQQAQAEQETAKVEAETALINAQKDADVKIKQAQADADATKIAAEAEAEANRLKSETITDNLIKMKEAEARLKFGWVTVQGANNTVVSGQ